MQPWIIIIRNSFGYWGALFLIADKNFFPPVSSEIILAFGNFVTSCANLNVWLFALQGIGRFLMPAALINGLLNGESRYE